MEVGPLARVVMGVVKNMPQYKDPALATLKELNLPLEAMFSTLGRHAARALEASFMADMMVKYVDDLIANIRADTANMEFWEPKTWPKQCKGVGADSPWRAGSLLRHRQRQDRQLAGRRPDDVERQPARYGRQPRRL